MKYQNILVAYDESDHAKKALETAFDFAGDNPDTKITIINIADVPDFESSSFEAAARMAGMQNVPEEVVKMHKVYIDSQEKIIKQNLKDMFGAPAENCTTVIGEGKASLAILNYAKENGIDCIIMGSRGLNAVRGMLGSVSYAVLRSAECAVVVVK